AAAVVVGFQLPISAAAGDFRIDPGESVMIPCLAPTIIIEQVRAWDLGLTRRRPLAVWETRD
ncbi:MAG: hypothetical protein L0H84_24410, partial [Pseudonocardia sp.]|nr:hypothetical protein [Pseudonocardia sp.]